ncbi:MAG: Gfo/Idh/MocA family oxidoreductase [Clostridiaceae bacterium]|nr:Gfo/Idh/MocA family oxidoreductase [Clostridiaceae bacterium]
MMNQKEEHKCFRVGLAGCGNIAPMHTQALAALPQVRLVGLADPDREASQKLKSTIAAEDAPECYDSLADLLAAAKPDVVHICTPHVEHVPLAVLALKHGCHVLMEKPPAIDLNGLSELSQAVAASGRSLGICFQNRFNAASQQARTLLQSGLAGRVLAARGFVTWNRDDAYYRQADWRGKWASEGGGVMINQAIHTLDLLIWLAGRPTQVEGHIANRHLQQTIEVEDTAEFLMTLENGAKALFYATTAYSSDEPVFLEIRCEQFRIRLEGDQLVLFNAEGELLTEEQQGRLLRLAADRVDELRRTHPDTFPADPYQSKADNLAASGKSCWGQGHSRLIGAFYQSLEEGRSFPVSLNEGSQALRVLLAVYESHRRGTPVILN